MAQSTLKEINDAVFDFLMERHYQNKEQGKPDSFLFVMATDESRLKQSLWLPGDNDSIWVSFLTRNGRESAVYIRIANTADSPVSLVLKSSEQLDGAIKLAPIAQDVSLATALNLSPENFDNTQYSRTFQSPDYLAVLGKFIAQEKEKVESTVLKYTEILSDKSFSVGQSIELKQFYEQFQKVQQWRMATEPTSCWSNKLMPYALQRLYVRNFRGIRALTLGPLPVDAKWIFITGQNGFGKSSLLQAVAVGLWGLRDESSNREWVDAQATIQGVFRAAENGLFYNDTDYQRYTFSYLRMMQGHLATYGSSRLQTNPTATQISADPTTQLTTLYHLFNTDGTFLAVDKWLTDLYVDDENQFKQVVKLLKAIIPALHDIEVAYSKITKVREATFYEKDETNEGKRNHHYAQGVSFKQLASGFQSIIALVADILRRLSAADSEVKPFKELAGIVIIDELELHLHPKLQRELPRKLSELFPNVQFIASTHSPIPLLGAPKESIVLTVDRTESTGVTVEQLDVDFSKLLPNSILTSPIFGFDDIIPESAPSIAEVETEDNYNEVLNTERLKKKLKILKAKLNDD